MVPSNLPLIPFLVLGLWRCLFTGMGRRWLVGEIDAAGLRQNGLFERGLRFLDPVDLTLVVGELENRTDGVDSVVHSRAITYLRRIVTLTRATQSGNCYSLHVGKTEFRVRGGYVRRKRDVTDPKCEYGETCFYSTQKEIPRAEQIATVLLQLRNNPALFDRWAAQNGLAFKADGQVFIRAQ